MSLGSFKSLVYGFIAAHTLASAPLAGEPALTADEKRELGFLAEGYLNNRESFRFLTCRYQITRGKASTREEALKGQLTEMTTQNAFWLVRDKLVRHDLEPDPRYKHKDPRKDMTTAPVGNGKGVGFLPPGSVGAHYLSDGAFQLGYSPLIRGANLYIPTEQGIGIIDGTPLSMGWTGDHEQYNPGVMLRQCIAGERPGRLEGMQRVGDVETMSVSLDQWKEHGPYRLYFDPERGFLPILSLHWYYADHKERGGFEYRITDIKQCSHGRWFPYRIVGMPAPEEPVASRKVLIIAVTDLDVDTPPRIEDFYVDLPKRTQVGETAPAYAFISMGKNERINVGDLPRLHERCALNQRREERREAIRQYTQRRRRLSTLGIAGGVALAVLAGLLGLLYIRRRRKEEIGM